MTLFESMGQMNSISIGLWVTGFMLVFVVMGVRVAFAAALAGFLGLLWIFSVKMGFERGFLVAMKMAGTITAFKSVYAGTVINSYFYFNRFSGLSCRVDPGTF